MPEIWLGYGDSEVILDIKYENIFYNNRAEFQLLDNELLNIELEKSIQLKKNILVLNFNPFVQMIPILRYITQKSKETDANILEINTLSKNIPLKFKKIMNEEGLTINKIEKQNIMEKIKEFEQTIVVEKIEYDPLFGFKGAPTEIIRSSFPNEMNDIYLDSIEKYPQSGIKTSAINISIEISKKLNYEPIHVISNNDGINSIYANNHNNSFLDAVDKFCDISKKELEKSKASIVSGNSNFDIQATLSNSLNLLWNNLNTVKENGTLILLSENKMGIGDEKGALFQMIENKLDNTDLKKWEYLKDLEHINFLNLVKDKLDIYAVSSLPNTFLTRLGIKPLPRIKEGLEAILKRYGKNTKILIIPNSELTKIVEPTSHN